jgi:hypothetical protein
MREAREASLVEAKRGGSAVFRVVHTRMKEDEDDETGHDGGEQRPTERSESTPDDAADEAQRRCSEDEAGPRNPTSARVEPRDLARPSVLAVLVRRARVHRALYHSAR